MIPEPLAAIRAPVRAALPRADLERATPLGEGWGVIAYRVPDSGGDWAVRLPRGSAFAAVTGDLAREVRLLPLLESAGLPSPREAIGIYASDGRALPQAQDERNRHVHPAALPSRGGGRVEDGRTGRELLAVAHRLVEGEPLTRARLGRGRRRAAYATAIGAFLTRLHAFPRAEARAAGVPELDLWADRYESMLADGRAQLGPRSRAWLDETVERFLAAGGMRGAPRTLIHGDIAPAHVLVRDGAFAGVIDFGDALIADPALDFGGLLLAYGWPFTEQVLDAYGGEIDAHFRRRMTFYVDVVPIFLVTFGHMFNGGQDRIDGLRQFAARAAAASRR